jgi:hypothetical protein
LIHFFPMLAPLNLISASSNLGRVLQLWKACHFEITGHKLLHQLL